MRIRLQLRERVVGFENSSTHSRPPRMVRGSRENDQVFLAGHLLFHRCSAEDILGDRLNPTRIKYNRTSCNWSKYSKPWDVIFDHPEHGIVRFIVRCLPRHLPKVRTDKNVKEYSFFPRHDPEELNYSHSEIRTFREEELLDKVSLPETVKKEFRTIMSDKSYLLRHPRA